MPLANQKEQFSTFVSNLFKRVEHVLVQLRLKPILFRSREPTLREKKNSHSGLLHTKAQESRDKKRVNDLIDFNRVSSRDSWTDYDNQILIETWIETKRGAQRNCGITPNSATMSATAFPVQPAPTQGVKNYEWETWAVGNPSERWRGRWDSTGQVHCIILPSLFLLCSNLQISGKCWCVFGRNETQHRRYSEATSRQLQQVQISWSEVLEKSAGFKV